MSERNLSPQQFGPYYHGTTGEAAAHIDTHGIKANDIGAVYATNNSRRAEAYARSRSRDTQDQPTVVEFHAKQELSQGARPEEFIHWGDVHPHQIKSIWEASLEPNEYDERMK